MGWDGMIDATWQRNEQCHSLPVGHGMRHDWYKAISLTCCWWWDETQWLMRLLDKEINQCHSHSVGYEMRWHDWWDHLAKKWTVSLTFYWPWDETWLMRLPGKENTIWRDMVDEATWQRNEPVSLTVYLSWDKTWLMRLSGKEIMQCHSQSVGHGMRHDWWDCLAKK